MLGMFMRVQHANTIRLYQNSCIKTQHLMHNYVHFGYLHVKRANLIYHDQIIINY